MIVTCTQIANNVIYLASHSVNSQVELAFVTWQGEGDWQALKPLHRVKKQYEITEDTIGFIDQCSLSTKNENERLLLATIAQLKQYEAGKRQNFSLPLDTRLGTPFQQKVWQALQDIGYGETISYAKLAENISQPKAFRAVANANGKNPFSIVIPCHRVIASSGGLGGYTGGLDKKQALLNLEQGSYE